MDEISEYPYTCQIYRVIQGSGMTKDQDVLLYEGVCDEHMTTYEVGRELQTASYIVSIPMTKDNNGNVIMPCKGDKMDVNVYGTSILMIVDNVEPSQLGGISIMATRNAWTRKPASANQNQG